MMAFVLGVMAVFNPVRVQVEGPWIRFNRHGVAPA